jgi:hypothetical protein
MHTRGHRYVWVHAYICTQVHTRVLMGCPFANALSPNPGVFLLPSCFGFLLHLVSVMVHTQGSLTTSAHSPTRHGQACIAGLYEGGQ